MFIVLLKFSDNRDRVGEYLEGHRAWLQRGFDDGVFLLAGRLQPGLGGGILAHDTTREDIEKRVSEDPFVAERVVVAEIFEIAPARTDERLQFLSA